MEKDPAFIEDSPYTFTYTQDSAILSSIKEWTQHNIMTRANLNAAADYELDSMYIVKDENLGNIDVIVVEKKIEENVVRALGFYRKDGVIVNALEVEVDNTIPSESKLTYRDGNNMMFSLKLKDGVFELESPVTRGYGQDVMDCITDHYSKKGWMSVALWVGTAFYPGVALSVTGACAVIAA